MLILVEYIGRYLLWFLIGSWAHTELPRARNFALAAGSLVLGLVVGLILYRLHDFFPVFKIDRLSAFVWLPTGVMVFTFVIEAIKKEIQKNAGQTT